MSLGHTTPVVATNHMRYLFHDLYLLRSVFERRLPKILSQAMFWLSSCSIWYTTGRHASLIKTESSKAKRFLSAASVSARLPPDLSALRALTTFFATSSAYFGSDCTICSKASLALSWTVALNVASVYWVRDTKLRLQRLTAPLVWTWPLNKPTSTLIQQLNIVNRTHKLTQSFTSLILRIKTIRKIKWMLVYSSELLNQATTQESQTIPLQIVHCGPPGLQRAPYIATKPLPLKGLMLQFGIYLSEILHETLVTNGWLPLKKVWITRQAKVNIFKNHKCNWSSHDIHWRVCNWHVPMLNTESEILKETIWHQLSQIHPSEIQMRRRSVPRLKFLKLLHSSFFFEKDHHPTHPTHPPTLKGEKNSQLGEPNHHLLLFINYKREAVQREHFVVQFVGPSPQCFEWLRTDWACLVWFRQLFCAKPVPKDYVFFCMRAKLVSLVVDSGWSLSFLAVVLAFTYCLFWWRNPFVAPWSCVGLFLRCSRSSSWPCRSEDFLLVKRKCNNCKRSRYQGSAKQESKTPRHKQQTPTQNQANPKENTLVPRCLGEKVKQMRPKIPALSPSPHLKKKNDFPCFFLLAAAWVDPGRSALQSAEQRCQRRYGRIHRFGWTSIYDKNMQEGQ